MTEREAMAAIASRLGAVLLVNGYSSDAGERVIEFRDQLTLLDQTPYLAIRFDGRDPIDAGTQLIGCPHIRVRATFEIVGVVELDDDNRPDRPMALIDDLDRVLFSAEAAAAFAAQGLTLFPGSALVLPAEDGDAHTEVQTTVTAEFTKRLTP